jgi:hypothetical protein
MDKIELKEIKKVNRFNRSGVNNGGSLGSNRSFDKSGLVSLRVVLVLAFVMVMVCGMGGVVGLTDEETYDSLLNDNIDSEDDLRTLWEALSKKDEKGQYEDKETIQKFIQALDRKEGAREQFIKALAKTKEGYNSDQAAENLHRYWENIPGALEINLGQKDYTKKLIAKRQEIIDELYKLKGSNGHEIYSKLLTNAAKGKTENKGLEKLEISIPKKTFEALTSAPKYDRKAESSGETFTYNFDSNKELTLAINDIPKNTKGVTISHHGMYGDKNDPRIYYTSTNDNVMSYNLPGVTIKDGGEGNHPILVNNDDKEIGKFIFEERSKDQHIAVGEYATLGTKKDDGTFEFEKGDLALRFWGESAVFRATIGEKEIDFSAKDSKTQTQSGVKYAEVKIAGVGYEGDKKDRFASLGGTAHVFQQGNEEGARQRLFSAYSIGQQKTEVIIGGDNEKTENSKFIRIIHNEEFKIYQITGDITGHQAGSGTMLYFGPKTEESPTLTQAQQTTTETNLPAITGIITTISGEIRITENSQLLPLLNGQVLAQTNPPATTTTTATPTTTSTTEATPSETRVRKNCRTERCSYEHVPDDFTKDPLLYHYQRIFEQRLQENGLGN